MLHGRRGFTGAREHVRLLVWTAPAGSPPPAHLARAAAAAQALAAQLDGAPAAVLRRLGLGAPPPAAAAIRVGVVLEMLRGVPPGVLAARERIAEPELYRLRDEALAAAEAALAGELPAGDEAMARALASGRKTPS